MNKKIVTLILVILISFSFLSVVVADNGTHHDKNTTGHDNKKIDKDSKDNKTKKNYILAKGSGNNVKFSDGYKGFRLDYSKHPANSGDEFKHASTSKASNSNTLKLAVIECYRQNSEGQMSKIMADFIKTGSSNTKVGEAVANSHETVGDHAVVKIDNHTEAVFDFEVLQSVSGNESDYFAYKVSFRTINEEANQTNNLTNVTNTTNITNMTLTVDNDTNATSFLDDLYDYLASLIDSLYGAWKPLIDTLVSGILMLANALEDIVNMFETFMAEIQSLMSALEEFSKMLESIWSGLDGLIKLLGVIMSVIGQILNLIGSILNFIVGLISAIISLVQQILGLVFALIGFIINILSQILGLIQALLSFLQSVGSALIKVFENAAIIIAAFVVITIGAFVYNRTRHNRVS